MFTSPITVLTSLLRAVPVRLPGCAQVFTIFGIFFGVDNGWGDVDSACLACAAVLNITVDRMHVPQCATVPTPHFCTINEEVFNFNVKGFVILFSYINGLPIPWRLSIAAHLFCSSRPSHEGVDFYGRPTEAIWFHIRRRTRQKIAVGLNGAWLLAHTHARLYSRPCSCAYMHADSMRTSSTQALGFSILAA